ncbi:hypothetical protein [Corynebacterium guangdongense]|uniref:Na+/proline symporter n=1 Tax=Corynebacterium guangdongense TaxID=1783348 RepID=A0ABU1ZZR2_9CORY|nr:hypothetical protein [Corynebacterium guangdongense]MDR7330414.1 Na+/proline symporter [Corynebacterium guangdongense]WJZ18972.1 hypothetical protein CGUA_12180 [Corynebacterium guangdongense]
MRSPDTRVAERRPREGSTPRNALSYAVLVFLAGFGALHTLALIEGYPDDLREPFTYWSETLGHAIFLPMAAAGWHLAGAQLPRTPLSHHAGKVGALLALALSAMVQLIWLFTLHPAPSWLLPQPHSFSLVGWYHAAFTCLVTALIGQQIGEYIASTSRPCVATDVPPEKHRLRRTGVGVGWAGLMGMFVAVLADHLPHLADPGSQATVGAALLLAAGPLLAGALLRPVRSPGWPQNPGEPKGTISPMTHSSHIRPEGARSPGRRESYVVSVAFAVTAFILGFVVLLALDLTVEPTSGGARVYSFWSTMLGYSLFLPATLASWQLARAQFPPSSAGRLVGVLVGLLAAAVMLYCQAVWILDPDPRPNWTLGAPHSFNLLGWYNTVFTVAVSGIGGFIIGDLLTRLNSGPGVREMPKERRQVALAGLTLGTAGLVAFGVTVLLDHVAYLDHFSSQATVITTLLVTGIMILVLRLMRPDTRSLHTEP